MGARWGSSGERKRTERILHEEKRERGRERRPSRRDTEHESPEQATV